MVENSIEAEVIALVLKYYGAPLFGGSYPTITLDTDLDTDLGLEAEDTEELLAELFTKYAIDDDAFDLETYYPAPSWRDMINYTLKRKAPSIVPDLTIRMLVESAKAGRWLY
ncbi:DUF1493 family protein [Enterobacillus tribolii]|uniref:Uncharacterized protein DUF1493 n=1 Tax=Enterobacillus tribolii TaxID=1487935 RepID=A0A370R4Y4_9GAMM|nr:DUF1493 family protein [Enterobacillus tribolii]MBW7983431.1 DUF1493 family protein [Enterobacillus tribolii]RDK97491.1 uncharacterized protein DUF1493 [Enterobacillus tribolii]